MFTLLDVTRYHSARYSTFQKATKNKRVLCLIYNMYAPSTRSNDLTSVKQFFTHQGFIFVLAQFTFDTHHAVIERILN